MVCGTSPDSSVTSGCRQILSASDATMFIQGSDARTKNIQKHGLLNCEKKEY